MSRERGFTNGSFNEHYKQNDKTSMPDSDNGFSLQNESNYVPSRENIYETPQFSYDHETKSQTSLSVSSRNSANSASSEINNDKGSHDSEYFSKENNPLLPRHSSSLDETSSFESDLSHNTSTRTKISRACSKLCSPANRLFNKLYRVKAEDYVILRRIIFIPIGFVIAAGVYFTVIRALKLPYYIRDTMGAILCVFLAIGFGCSIQVRCIVCLMIPVFFAKKGRAYITAYAIAILIAGPVSNILQNGGEVVRSLSCSAELLANHTKAKANLRFKPIKQIAKDLQKEGFNLEDVVQKIKYAFNPIRREISDNGEVRGKRYKTRELDGSSSKRIKAIEDRYRASRAGNDAERAEMRYEKKLDYRCEDIFNEAVLGCRRKFREAEQRCMDKLWILGYILCLPLKLTFLCEILRLVPTWAGLSCNSKKIINPGLGETYVAAKKTMKQFDKQFDVSMKYKLERSRELIDFVDVKEAVLAIKNEFKGKQSFMELVLSIIQIFFAFTFLLLFIAAYKYHKKYLSEYMFDNIYVTSYFRRIDARRYDQGKRTLLPLKKMEASKVHDRSRLSIKKTEKRSMIKGLMKLSVHIIIAIVVISVDRLLYGVMDIIQRHSRIDYRQQGVHEINVQVFGTGFLAKIIRDVLKHFNQKHSIDNISTNFKCLPNPTAVDPSSIYTVFGIYGLVVALLILESYGLRLRRIIASFFYPKREKRRILYLYNDILKKRVGFFHHVKRHIKDLARKRQLSRDVGIIVTLTETFPRACFLLKKLATPKNKCLICEEPAGKDFLSCPTADCNFCYCLECWHDLKETCYACMPEEDFSSTSESDASDNTSD